MPSLPQRVQRAQYGFPGKDKSRKTHKNHPLENSLKFEAAQEKSLQAGHLAHLPTIHAQRYPQIL